MKSPRMMTAWILAASFCVPAIAQEKTATVAAVAEKAWQSQDWAAAAEAYAKVVKASPDDATAWHRLGYALHAQRKLDEALKAHVKAASFTGKAAATGAYNAACVYALRADKEKAFQWLSKAVDAGFNTPEQFADDPDMDSLRGDPRFAKIVARVKSQGASLAKVRVFNYSAPRQSTRATYFAGQSSPGQLAIDYGVAAWKPEYKGVLDNKKYMNRRWRFGANAWTTLDTNVPVTLGGQKIPAGQHYLTITNLGDKKIVLNVIDADSVRKMRIDPFLAHLTTGGIDVPLQHQELAESTDLAIEIKMQKVEPTKGALVVRFGPHELTASVKVHLAR